MPLQGCCWGGEQLEGQFAAGKGCGTECAADSWQGGWPKGIHILCMQFGICIYPRLLRIEATLLQKSFSGLHSLLCTMSSALALRTDQDSFSYKEDINLHKKCLLLF